MVSGVNGNSYTVDKLKEIRTNEVNISNNKNASSKSVENSDEANVKYTIKDDAGEVNEAQKEMDKAKEDKKNLKNILEDLIPKCDDKNKSMEAIKEELAKYEVQMDSLSDSLEDMESELYEPIKEVQARAKEVQAELDKKNGEIEKENKTVEGLKSKENLSDEEKSAVLKSTQKINSLKGESTTLQKEADGLNSKISTKVKAAAQEKLRATGESMEGIKNKAQSSLNDAINANEYADVTIAKGIEAANIKENKDAIKNGFGYNGFFVQQSLTSAKAMGAEAIAKGELLGNNSKDVGKQVKTISDQYGIGFDKSSSINSLIEKEYIDTSAMADVKEFVSAEEYGPIRANIINEKIAVDNQKIYDSVADDVLKKEEEKKTQ